MSIATTNPPSTYQLELSTGAGPRYRTVLRTPPRPCLPSEIPVISLKNLHSPSPTLRTALAEEIRKAATTSGFFYIADHGISEGVISGAEMLARRFFGLTEGEKERVARSRSVHYNGWAKVGSGQISPSETRDRKEGFMFRYDPELDLERVGEEIPEEVKEGLMNEGFVWEVEEMVPGFKEGVVEYWRGCLGLARGLMKVIARGLGVEEDYFDHWVTYPGGDQVFNFYPANTLHADTPIDVGIGAHTDIQTLTILWQDSVGGLQVLDHTGQWLSVPPIPGTFVVNIGDFLARLSNDGWQSTVHRVYNYSREERLSMPFFFGFNFNEKVGVLESCVGEGEEAKYEAISGGEWIDIRFGRAINEK